MDNITHSLVGALLGQMGLKRKTGLAMPTLIIAANIPDIDVLALALGGHQHLAIRRGITHGPIAWVVLPLLLWAAMLWFDRWQTRRGKRPEKRLPMHKGWLLALAFMGCLSHPALDWLNNYGVRLLEPFSQQWFYGDSIFIIDVWMLAALALGVWFSLRRERAGKAWKWPALSAFSIILIYIGVNFLISASSVIGFAINNKVIEDVDDGTSTATRIYADTVISSPPPIISWRREMIVGGRNDWFRIPFDRVAAPENAISITPKRCVWPDRADLISGGDDLKAFLFWSRAPFAEQADDGSILIGDARYTDQYSREQFTVRLPKLKCIPLMVNKPTLIVFKK